MKRLDWRRQLVFCDFSRPEYDTASIGVPPSELSRVIHARWADGNVITGVKVFGEMWEAVGFGVLAALSHLPFIEPLVLRTYAWFARNRLWLTGRANPCQGGPCRLRPQVDALGDFGLLVKK
jgi:predicted DCC family thiol-disulfide oxidoreductase YuxK